MSEKAYNKDWARYYLFLEELRQSGATNMYGAAPYLEQAYDDLPDTAMSIVVSWMENYDELVEDGVIDREPLPSFLVDMLGDD